LKRACTSRAGDPQMHHNPFAAACSVGAAANVGIAAFLYSRSTEWVLAPVSGVIVGAVWNYAVTSVYTWGKKGT
jgi:dolichol-phosphate mannosyltransferase